MIQFPTVLHELKLGGIGREVKIQCESSGLSVHDNILGYPCFLLPVPVVLVAISYAISDVIRSQMEIVDFNHLLRRSANRKTKALARPRFIWCLSHLQSQTVYIRSCFAHQCGRERVGFVKKTEE